MVQVALPRQIRAAQNTPGLKLGAGPNQQSMSTVVRDMVFSESSRVSGTP
jgi:hypothetical protein